MKLKLKWILLIAILIISCYRNSLNAQNITYGGFQKTTIKTLEDSLLVPKKYIKAAVKCYIEVDGCRRIAGLHQAELHGKDIQIQFYKKAFDSCDKANDTLSAVTIPTLEKQVKNYETLYLQYKQESKRQKRAKITSSVLIPVVATVSAVIGFYVGKGVK